MQEILTRTEENWTWGIINIPLLFGHNNRLGVTPKTIIRKVAHNARCYKKPYYALDKSQRYLWFESDTTNAACHSLLRSFYKHMEIDVYWHRTMKGYHYICLKQYDRQRYEYMIERLKDKLDNGTFFYSLRIVPNKWEGELFVWFDGQIDNNGSGHYKQLDYIRQALNQRYYFNFNKTIPKTVLMLDNMFCISRYQFKKALLS